MQGSATERETRAIKVGRFAPYPVWLATSVLVRASQILFLAFCLWYLAALFDAMERPHRISTPPIWLWFAFGMIGADVKSSYRRWKTSPMGDAVGNVLASLQCPACGQDVFDRTPPSGYAPEARRHAFFPSRVCTNCGHDLARRTARRGET
jgi:hypothetical protein